MEFTREDYYKLISDEHDHYLKKFKAGGSGDHVAAELLLHPQQINTLRPWLQSYGNPWRYQKVSQPANLPVNAYVPRNIYGPAVVRPGGPSRRAVFANIVWGLARVVDTNSGYIALEERVWYRRGSHAQARGYRFDIDFVHGYAHCQATSHYRPSKQDWSTSGDWIERISLVQAVDVVLGYEVFTENETGLVAKT